MSQENTQDNPSEAGGNNAATTALTLAAIHSEIALAALAPEWSALCAALPVQHPFAEPDWNLHWWRHLRARRLLIHDRLHAFALRDVHGNLVAVAPMMISVRPGIGAFGVKVLQFFGADPNITEVRGLICHPGDSDAALAALQAYLLAHRHLWDWIEWQGLSPEQARQLSSPDIEQPKARVMCYRPLPSDWDTLKGGLSRNMKEAIRKCFNSLRRDGLQHTFEVIERPVDVTSALADFYRLHTLRARSAEGVPHADAFRDRRSRAFLSAHASMLAREGRLRIFRLRIGDQLAATRIGFVLGDQLYLYYSGYDPRWRSYSLMTTLVVETMRWAIAQGFNGVNLSTGRDQSKLRWQPQEKILHNAIQISPRHRSAVLFRAYTRLRSYPLLHRFSRKK